MIAGLSFVFVVQIIFYLLVKLWPKNNLIQKKSGEAEHYE